MKIYVVYGVDFTERGDPIREIVGVTPWRETADNEVLLLNDNKKDRYLRYEYKEFEAWT